MLLVRNAALTTGTTSPVAANYPTSPAPMDGSSLLIAIVNIDGVAATGIAASGWTSAGAAVTNGTTVQQCFYRNAASQTGSTSFSWTGASTYAEVFIFEVYSTQGSVPTLGTYATGSGTGTSATCPSPTLTQDSELLLFCITLAANTNILYPGGPSFASGFGGGAATLYTNINASTRSCVAMFGCAGTSLPGTMPATSWSGSEAWVMTCLPILEATAGDPVITGVGLIDNPIGGSANTSTSPAIPATAQSGDVMIAVVAQGRLSGSQATGQAVSHAGVGDLYVFADAIGTNSGTVSVVAPAGIEAGDMIVYIAESAGSLPSTPSGFTSQLVDSTSNFYLRISTKTAVGTEGGTTITSGGSSWYHGGIIVIRSRSGSTITWDTGGSISASSSNSTSVVTPSLTTGTNYELVIIGGGWTSNNDANPSITGGFSQDWGGSGHNSSDYGQIAVNFVQNTAGAIPTETISSGGENGPTKSYALAFISANPFYNPYPFTHIRQDNEPLSTFSLDLLWCEYSGGPSSVTFTVPLACAFLQGQIFSIGNLNTSSPIDDSQGNAQVECYSDIGAPPAPGVTAHTGFILWIWGLNYEINGGSNNLSVLPPVGLLTDTLGAGGGGGAPGRFFQVGIGTPDMAETPQYTRGGNANGFGLVGIPGIGGLGKGYVGQSLALKAASGPVYTSNDLEINSVFATVMGSAVAPPSSGWFWSINPFQM